MRDDTSAETDKLRSERDSAATCHHEMLSSIRRIAKVCEEFKGMAADTLVKLSKLCDKGQKVTVEVHVAE